MNLKKFVILTALAAVVSATTIPQIETTSTTEAANETNEAKSDSIIPSASIGNVEVQATTKEVKSDWTGDEDLVSENTDDDAVEEEEDDEYDDYDEDMEDDDDDEAFVDESDYPEEVTQEGFEANVPTAIHGTKDLVINKDNLMPILKTIVLAYTHKLKPSYTDIIKAGGITAFKTGFKYFGKEDLGKSLLKIAKHLTHVLDDEENDDVNSEILSELAEEYLSTHRFKLILPESVLLHQKEMDEFLETKYFDEIEGRALVSNKQIDIVSPRADPGVQTLFTFGPMSWIALLGGLFSIPYLLSGSEAPARVDHAFNAPSQFLEVPGLTLFQAQQLRRDENEQIPHQHVDQEYLEFQKSYAEWYNNWYLNYKSYYDEHFPNHQRPHPQNIQRQEVPSLDDVMVPPPIDASVKIIPQKAPHQFQKPTPPKHRLPKQPLPIQFPGTPEISRVTQAPRLSQTNVALPGINARNAAAAVHVVNTVNTNENSFGTFQSENNKGDTHFKVIQGPEANVNFEETTTRPRPIFSTPPSPQPVYISTTPTTESGFKPITKPNTPISEKNATPANDDKTGFKPPQEKSILSTDESSRTKSTTHTETADKTESGFRPISGPTHTKRTEVETSTIRVSGVTSGVFKTSPNPTPVADTTPNPVTNSDGVTPRPAVFVRTSTDKSVRVVTSSSFRVPEAAPLVTSKKPESTLPDLKRPQRHQESNPTPQHIPQEQKTQQQQHHHHPHQKPPQQQHLPLHQRLPHHQPPLPLQHRPQEQRQEARTPLVRPHEATSGFVRTNVPTTIQVIDHRPAQGSSFHQRPTEAPTTNTTTTPLPIYALDLFYGGRLSRTDVIFNQLGVEEEGCREQVVCNIYKNPDVYTPYSDFLSRQLTVKLEELQKPKVSDERILRFFRYLKAAREGQNGSDCLSKYPECHFNTLTLSHKPIMNAFEKVTRLISAGSNR